MLQLIAFAESDINVAAFMAGIKKAKRFLLIIEKWDFPFVFQTHFRNDIFNYRNNVKQYIPILFGLIENV